MQRFVSQKHHIRNRENFMSEYRLIKACKEGKLWAKKEVYEQYAPLMMALCKRYTGNNDDAKDVLQEGFLKIFTQIDQYAASGEFGGWVRKVFVNTVLEFLRTRQRIQQKVMLVDSQEYFPEQTEPKNLPSADELMECVAELPDTCRVVFNLFAIEGYRHQEIAAMLNIPEGTSRSHFFRARQMLKEKVNELINDNNAD